MTFYSDPQLRIIDFDITLSPQQEVKFGDTKEGMFAMRLAAPLEEEQPKDIAEPKRTGKMVNAQNKSGEKNVWGKRSEWVDYSGQIDGAAGRRRGVRSPVELRAIPPTGTRAPTDCWRPTFSACTISSATPRATPA